MGVYVETHADLAEAEMDRYLAYPTQAASYLTGAAEITGQAQASDKVTHDALTGCGTLPPTSSGKHWTVSGDGGSTNAVMRKML